MYFIVYIRQTSQYVVVPYSWIKLNDFMEWIVNNGINSNVPFEVFYTQNDDAYENGVPRIDFAPNVHASCESQFPNEGWYSCFIRRFKCMFFLKSGLKYTLRNMEAKTITGKQETILFCFVLFFVCILAKFAQP